MADDLIVTETLRADIVFAPGGVDAILDHLERDVRSVTTDISTKTGRAAITSLAHKVARSKTALDELGKNLVADWKARSAAVDADRRRVRERLDDLRDEVRQPLTDWESAEKARVSEHEHKLMLIEQMARFNVVEPLAADVANRIKDIIALPPREWHEFSKRAADTTAQVRASLQASHDTAIRREAERAELARLQKEALERGQRERDERLQREAAEKARAAAEAEARDAARAAHEKAERERAQVEREATEAKAAAGRAEERARQAEEQAKRDTASERDRVIAAEKKAEQAIEAAVEAERARAAAVKRTEKAKIERREADQRHRGRIDGEALEALLKLGITPDLGKTIVAAIAAGNVPHVRVTY
jgi:colicin import membrane protein